MSDDKSANHPQAGAPPEQESDDLSVEEQRAIEDALESCEQAEAWTFFSTLSPRVQQRLHDYQQVLQQSSTAFALTEVPEGVLSSVLMEAKKTLATASPTPRKTSFWHWLQRSWALPGVALAGTTALFLLWLRPEANELPLAESTPTTISSARESLPSQASAEASAPLDFVSTKTNTPIVLFEEKESIAEAEEAAEAAVEERQDRAEPLPPPTPKQDTPKSSPPRQSKGGDIPWPEKKASSAPLAKHESADAAMLGGAVGPRSDEDAFGEGAVDAEISDKQVVTDILERADRLRLQGHCEQASREYQKVTGVPGIYQAKAYAGLGLCAELLGLSKQAQNYFEQARKASSSIDPWIVSERNQMEAFPSAQKSAKKAKKNSIVESSN